MKNYQYTNFLVSDLHSYNKQFREALSFAGFNRKDKTHRLIVLGDIFDRGPDSLGIYQYLKSLPRHRKVLIKGNHEQLFDLLASKPFPDDYDFSNGTVKTFCHIAEIDPDLLDYRKQASLYYISGQYTDHEILDHNLRKTWRTVKQKVLDHEIWAWLHSDEWVDYFEFDKYICVHSFLPVSRCSYLVENWRQNASESDWMYSRWGCPWKQFNQGLFEDEAKNGKVLVCGHWHASDFHRVYEHDFRVQNNNLYFGKHLIALDAMTPTSGMINVLRINPDGTCFNQYREELKYGSCRR